MRHTYTKLAVCGLMAAASVPASADIYDISASDANGLVINLTPGQSYVATFVGMADGGMYDAANVQLNCQVQCVTGFSNAFSSRDATINPLDFFVDSYTTGQVYGSAADSLAAYQAGPITHFEAHVVNGVATTSNKGPIPSPFVFTAENGATRIVVVDTDNTRTNNTGGISIRIEEFNAPVPEPATWIMMIAGFGLVGSAKRRRVSLARSPKDEISAVVDKASPVH